MTQQRSKMADLQGNVSPEAQSDGNTLELVPISEINTRNPNSEVTDHIANVTVEEAIQGLLKAITFLEVNNISSYQHYVEMLWDIVEHIKKQTHTRGSCADLASLRYEMYENNGKYEEQHNTTDFVKTEDDDSVEIPCTTADRNYCDEWEASGDNTDDCCDNNVVSHVSLDSNAYDKDDEDLRMAGPSNDTHNSDSDYSQPSDISIIHEKEPLLLTTGQLSISDQPYDDATLSSSEGSSVEDDVDSTAGSLHKNTSSAMSTKEQNNADTNELELSPSDKICQTNSQSRRSKLTKHYRHQCGLCNKIMSNTRSLKAHMQVHRKDRIAFRCEVCSKNFVRKRNLNTHLLTHSREKDVTCDMHNEQFSDTSTLKSHLCTALVKETRVYKCETCSENFSTKRLMKIHMQVHKEKKSPKPNKRKMGPLLCSFCGQAYNREGCLQKHIKQSHNLKSSPPPECKCLVCDMHFHNSMELNKHKREESHYRCVLCDEGCNSGESLISHIQNHQENTITCPLCSKSFTSARTFVYHTKLHTGEELHKCSDCGETFVLRSDYLRHVSQHSDARPYECATCRKTFRIQDDLKAHKRHYHSDYPKRHLCIACGKTFRTSTELIEHSTVHSGEKPHACSLCDKRYARSSALYTHMKTHTGKNLSYCQICDKKFIHNSDLKRHMLTHTGEKSHECQECGKRFTQASNLRTHTRTHTGQKPYKCPICYNSFGHAVSLRGHMKQHDSPSYKAY